MKSKRMVKGEVFVINLLDLSKTTEGWCYKLIKAWSEETNEPALK